MKQNIKIAYVIGGLVVLGVAGWVIASYSAEPVSQNPPPPPQSGRCVPAGCSSQLCIEESDASGGVTTCEYRQEYACYRSARCERQANNKCGWTETPALRACLMNPPSL